MPATTRPVYAAIGLTAVSGSNYELMARFVHPHFQKSRDLLRASYD
jgi:hypothetical protein